MAKNFLLGLFCFLGGIFFIQLMGIVIKFIGTNYPSIQLSFFRNLFGIFPIIIFMGVGAMTDFGPLIANPKTALLGAAAQFGIFGSLVGAVFISQNTDIINFSLQDSAAISIIGGADGPTAIFIASRLAPDLLGAIAVAAYSYMALVPIIQPPIMKALTTESERKINGSTKKGK